MYSPAAACGAISAFAAGFGAGLGVKGGASFSAGMRKRLSFARLLMQNAKIVLLDEPYGQLDPEGFALIDDSVREMRSRGVAVVIATHQLEHVTNLADHAITLEAGRIV